MTEIDLNEVQAEIEDLKARINKEQNTASVASTTQNDEGLSLSLERLALLNSRLGHQSSITKYLSRNAKQVVDALKEEQDYHRSKTTLLLIGKGSPVGRSEHEAKMIAHELYKDKRQKAFEAYTEVKLIADDVDDLVFRNGDYLKIAQSRLSLLKADKK